MFYVTYSDRVYKVYAVDDYFFLIYKNGGFIWVNMKGCAPYEKGNVIE